LLFGSIIMLNSSIQTVTIDEGLESVNLVRYVEQCMQIKVETTVDLLFKQGGWLYKEDGGYISDTSDLVTTLFLNNLDAGTRQAHIAYGITDDSNPVYQVPLNYKRPLNTLNAFGHPEGVFNTDASTPYFGRNVLPKLCNRNGPNGIHADAAFSCLPQLYNYGDVDKNNTIQSQLNHALSGAVFSCVQDAQTRYDFSHEGDGSVDIVFGDTTLEVPVNLTLLGDNFKTPLSFSYDMRVKQLYSFVYLFVDRDTKDINFDKRTDAATITSCTFDGLNCYDDSLIVTILPEFVENNSSATTIPGYEFDDILVISDRRSPLTYTSSKNNFIERDFLLFQFAVENRRPYLEVMPNLPTDARIIGDDFSAIARSNLERTFTFDMFFYDPDEDVERMYADDIYYTIVRDGTPQYYSASAATRLTLVSSYFDQLDLTYRTDGLPGLQGEITVSCSTQCHYSSSPLTDPDSYSTSYYYMKARINDGELDGFHEDFQTFDIVVSPR
jgi:hypothetical protein